MNRILIFVLLLNLSKLMNGYDLCELSKKKQYFSNILMGLSKRNKKSSYEAYMSFDQKTQNEPCNIHIFDKNKRNVTEYWKPKDFLGNKVTYVTQYKFEPGIYSIQFKNNVERSFEIIYSDGAVQENAILLNSSKNVVNPSNRLQVCLNYANKSDEKINLTVENPKKVKVHLDSLNQLNITLHSSSKNFNFSVKCELRLGTNLVSNISMKFIYNSNRYEVEYDEYLIFSNFSILMILVLLIACFIIIWKRKNSEVSFLSMDSTTGGTFEKDHDSVREQNWITNRLIKPSEITIEKEIGSGEFGQVFSGKMKDGPFKIWDIALKQPKEFSDKDSLVEEGHVLSKFGQHNHIVNLQGVTRFPDGRFCLIFQYCHNGALESFLRKSRVYNKRNRNSFSSRLSYNNLLTFGLEVASGMNHLEKCGIVHGDIASRNVLLDSHFTAKISDFGLSHVLNHEDSAIFKSSKQPIPWLSPESIKDYATTHKSDVWAYGVLLWEIFSLGEPPYEGWSNKSIQSHIEKGLHLSMPKLSTLNIWSVMLSCWHIIPSQRPTFEELEKTVSVLILDRDHINQHQTRVKNFKRLYENILKS